MLGQGFMRLVLMVSPARFQQETAQLIDQQSLPKAARLPGLREGEGLGRRATSALCDGSSLLAFHFATGPRIASAPVKHVNARVCRSFDHAFAPLIAWHGDCDARWKRARR
jgi:hypothetical protein